MIFVAIYVSADNQHTRSEPVEAPDIDAAAEYAVENLEGPAFGVGSAWFVAGVVQESALMLVSSAIEAEL